MAISFTTNSEKPIEFNEFIDQVSKIIDPKDEESLLDCINPLFSLANNKVFFSEILNRGLSGNLDNFQKGNEYSEQSYMLFEGDFFFIRMTFWPMISENERVRDSQNDLFSYGMVHDHNFSLLTAGYTGSGYVTKLWEYDYNNVLGYIGEQVDIKFLEEFVLSPGKALFYRPSRDIHSQYAPVFEDSLAINIIYKSPITIRNKQYEFDVEKSRIKRIIRGRSNSIFNLLALTTYSYNDETKVVLEKIGISHGIPEVRKQSLLSLFEITKDSKYLEMGVQDANDHLSKFFILKLREISV